MADASGPANQWYVALKGKKHGPVPEEKLAELLRAGKLKGTAMVWAKGFKEWTRIADTGLVRYLNESPPGSPPAAPAPPAAPETPTVVESPDTPDEAMTQEIPREDSGPGWYVMVNDERVGPVDEPTLGELLQTEKLSPKTLAWQKGMAEWLPAWKTPLVKFIGREDSAPAGGASSAPNMDADDDDDFGALKGGPDCEAEVASMNKLNLMFVIALLGCMFSGGLSLWALSSAAFGLGILLLIISLSSWVMTVLMGSLLLNRFWHVIQDNDVPINPKMAVGFMFIPFFNFYWVFKAHHTLAGYLNIYLAQRHIPGRYVSNKMVLAMCITFIAACVAPLTMGVPGLGRFVNFASLLAFVFLAVLSYQSLNSAAQGVLLYKGDPPDMPSDKFPMAMSLGIAGGIGLLSILYLVFVYFFLLLPMQRMGTDWTDVQQWDEPQWDTPYSDLPIDPFDSRQVPTTEGSVSNYELDSAARAAESALRMSYTRALGEGRMFSCQAAMDDMQFNRMSSDIEISLSSAGNNDPVDGCLITVSARDGTSTTISWRP